MSVDEDNSMPSSRGEKIKSTTVVLWWQKWKLLFSLRLLKDKVRLKGRKKRKKYFFALDNHDVDDDTNLLQNNKSEHVVLRFNNDVISLDISKLDHSAARHKIAIRPPNRRRGKHPTSLSTSDINNNYSTPSETCDLTDGDESGHVVSSSTRSWSFTSGSGFSANELRSDSSSERKSSVNSNVIFFKRINSPGHHFPTSCYPQCNKDPIQGVASHQKFLTSIEHWALANEGLRKSIFDLASVSHLIESVWQETTTNLSRFNSLDSICSTDFSFETGKTTKNSSNIMSMDTQDTSDGCPEHSSTSGETSVKSQSTLVSDTQCDAENTEVEVSRAILDNVKVVNGGFTECPIKDELEDVNVKERRKVFMVMTTSGEVKADDDKKSNSLSKSCSNLDRSSSHVKELVLKFDRFVKSKEVHKSQCL